MLNHLLYNEASMIPNTAGYLQRPHLDILFQEAIQKPLITVTAGAGYGKTQAISALLQDSQANTVWLSLSSLDNIVTRLWERYVYAISLLNKELSDMLELLGFPDSNLLFIRYLELMTENMVSNEKRFIVLDDFHLITDRSIIQFIDRSINARIANISIILISRSELSINTASLHSKGLLFGITEDDLRFKKSEMVNYFEAYNIKLFEQQISEIYDYTDGWIFAIYIIRLSFKKIMDYSPPPLSAIKLDIFKMIENEVFLNLSKELKSLLIKLSLFENLPSGLLKVLSSNNTILIKEMMEIKSFIRYDATFDTYRIHNLFLEYLQGKQDELRKNEVMKLHVKAAKWYANNAYKIDAIIHYERSNCYDEIFDIILEYSSFYSIETAKFITAVLDRMPKKIYEENPIRAIIRAKLRLNQFRIDEAFAELSAIKEKYEVLPPTPQNKTIVGEACIILGVISFITSFSSRKYEYKQLFKQADECLPDGSTIVNSNLHLNKGTYACMVMHPDAGEFERFQEAMEYTMPYASRVMNGCGYGMEYLTMAEAGYYKRDLKNAEKNAYIAVYTSQKTGQYDIENMAIFYLIRINIAYGHYSEVTALLERIKQKAETQHSLDCYAMLNIIEGWFYAMVGQIQKVAGWIKDDSNDHNEASSTIFSLHYFVRTRCYLAEQKYHELMAFLEQQDINYGVEDFLVGAIEIRVLKAIALYNIKEHAAAMTSLQEAYNLANPNSLIMPFVEYGSYMRTLIHTAIKDKNCKIPKQWLENIYTKSSTYAKKISNIVGEYNISNGIQSIKYGRLTKREIEVLSDLSHGLTREEIADNCSLSINTVKSMLQIIYTKLGAVNSLDAVRIAMQMGLFK